MDGLRPLEVKDRVIFDDFDIHDPKNMGRPLFWDLNNHIIAIEQMICADEIEMALKMFDMVPAWYRENYPEELTRLKSILYQNLYDPYDYASDGDEASWNLADVVDQSMSPYVYPRLDLLANLVKGYNDQGKTPFVCELSTSHGVLPIGLQVKGLKFNFFGKNLNHRALIKLREWLLEGCWSEAPHPDQPTIFVFTESLEHTYREEDLLNAYNKLGIRFDHLLLSVPYGTMGGGLSNWKTRRIGHIRAYTQDDFVKLATRFFPNYSWAFYKSVSMCLVGDRR